MTCFFAFFVVIVVSFLILFFSFAWICFIICLGCYLSVLLGFFVYVFVSFYFSLFLFLLFALSFVVFVWVLFVFLVYLLCCMTCHVMLPRQGVRPKHLWWECWIQVTRLPENFRPQGKLISVSSPRGPHLSTKTRLHPIACKALFWTPQTKQPAKQKHSLTHQQKWDDREICSRGMNKVKT